MSLQKKNKSWRLIWRGGLSARAHGVHPSRRAVGCLLTASLLVCSGCAQSEKAESKLSFS